MPVKIKFQTLKSGHFIFNAAAFLPEEGERKELSAVLTHGYTASKSDQVSWAQRLSDAGIPAVIFDLPGHYLGGLHPVSSFEDFRDHAVECFETAASYLDEGLGRKSNRYALAGHSLGALLSIKALERDKFANSLAIGVGLGISQHKTAHLFESSFYQKTLNIRRQLVAPELDSDLVFPWINEEKRNLEVTGKRVHLICGEDDVVVGKGGMQALADHLKKNGNQVSVNEPKKLPHHEPGSASTHVYHFLKKELAL